jgi:hypothetical protein
MHMPVMHEGQKDVDSAVSPFPISGLKHMAGKG